MPPPTISSTVQGSGANGKLLILIKSTSDVHVDVDVSIKSPIYAFTGGDPTEDDTYGSHAAAWRNRKLVKGKPLNLVYGWSTSSDRATPYSIVVRVRDQDTFVTHWGHVGSSNSILAGLDEGSKQGMTRWWLEKLPEIDPKLLEELVKKLPPPPRGGPPREER